MKFIRQRQEMVKKLVVEAGIEDPKVVQAMLKVPRHHFVDPALNHQAYTGSSLPIGYNQTISHPTTVALMTAALELQGDERVLEIGTGSGYQAAVLAEIGVKVFSIERIPELGQRARHIFEQLNYYSIWVKIGDGSEGWPEKSPFDRIIITAAAPDVPQHLLGQLKIGGMLVAPVGNAESQYLVRIKRLADKYEGEKIEWRKFVPLIGKKGYVE
ncbi:MAG: protein-L-isoaspartate(D-aspartate) O-methyltransferase [Calditrichia bacterium]